jgi:VanZ family protein
MRLRLLSALLWTATILVACWTPDIYLPVREGQGFLFKLAHLDKVVHLGIFGVFAVLWLRALPLLPQRFLRIGLAGAALAAITEIVQNLPIVHRDGELSDWVADVTGLLLATTLFYWLEWHLPAWVTGRPLAHVSEHQESALEESAL